MAKGLTVASLDRFTPDPNKRLEIPDGYLAGLYFVVQPTGRKSWAVRYRSHGKPRKLVLGGYPAISLAEAREAARAALRSVAEGNDPADAKRAARYNNAAEKSGLENVTRTFFVRYAKPRNRSWIETARQLGLVPDRKRIAATEDDAEREALLTDPMKFRVSPASIVSRWGHRPVGSILRAEIIDLLDEIRDRGSPVMANRTLAALRKLMNWAVERGYCDANPAAMVKPPSPEVARDRVLADAELSLLWRSTATLGPLGQMVRLLVLTGQRRDEVAQMRWREVDGDTWTIPKERMKGGRDHTVPLSLQAQAVLQSVPKVGRSGFVFTTNGERPVSGFSKAKAAIDRKMAETIKKDDADAELTPWRLHDIRRTVATGMAGLGIALPVIERILNHTSGTFGGIVGVYQRFEFADEKRAALEAWGKHVEGLLHV
jgi:integrase